MSELLSGERQVAPELDGIRRDHVARYEWAAERLAGGIVADAGCGVGYGSAILARAGCTVRAYDRSVEAIEYAQAHYNHNPNIKFGVGDVTEVQVPQSAHAVVAFEILEHLDEPEKALKRFRQMGTRLYASVPNESVFPHRGRVKFHHRHYTRNQFRELLFRNGWKVVEWWGQHDDEAEPEPDVEGRTLIAVCDRHDDPVPLEPARAPVKIPEHLILNGSVPESVAIVAMGGSVKSYIYQASKLGNIRRLADEIWTVNVLGNVIQADRLFHMDDMRIQVKRADGNPEGSVAGMMEWMHHHPGPVYTSKVYDEYPGAVEYPLEWVCTASGHMWMNNTAVYAVAMAVAMGVKHIHLYGVDYAYPGDGHRREKGMACMMYWLGIAQAKGILITIPDTSALFGMDSGGPEQFYGYDAEHLTVTMDADGFHIERKDRAPEDIPTADQMEIRYSHDPRTENLEHLVKT
jgi:SAM-dependent methyltransferase